MKTSQKIYISLFVFFGSFISSISYSYAFLGEDLGLDLYKSIDEGFATLEQKQYEYEMTGQGETTVNDFVNKQLGKIGLECQIDSTDDIEKVLGSRDQLKFLFERCSQDGEKISSTAIIGVLQELDHIRGVKKQDAQNKSKDIYKISRIGLYSDGVSENSPFDLIVDLQEIDKIIFGEEIEYNGEEWQGSGDQLLNDFLEEDKTYLYTDTGSTDEENTGTGGTDTPPTGTGGTDTPSTGTGGTDTPEHEYFCRDPLSESGFGSGSLDNIDDIIDLSNLIDNSSTGSIVITRPRTPITDGEYGNGGSWGGPFQGPTPNSPYSASKDDWNCRDQFFCIIIEFVMTNNNLLGGGESLSIKKVLAKASEHLEKFANTSLVQSKMTQNNFELGLIIPNLGDLLRGLGIQVQTKPAPILNNIDKSADKENATQGDMFTGENLLARYYKNVGLDYERANDMDIFRGKTYERQVLEESAYLPINFPFEKLQELQKFEEGMAETNRIVSLGVEKQAIMEDQNDFFDQFTELERFVGSIEDFSASIVGIIKKMKQIPTRSS